MSTCLALDHIGVGIDTARYGHRVSFLRPDRSPAAAPLTVMENREGYQALEDRLRKLRGQHPKAHFHVRALSPLFYRWRRPTRAVARELGTC